MQSLPEASRGVGIIAEGGSFSARTIPLRARMGSRLLSKKSPTTLSLLATVMTTEYQADERQSTAATIGYLRSHRNG